MRIAIATILALLLAVGLGACQHDPAAVSIEAVPPHRFARDLDACMAQYGGHVWPGNPVKYCMEAKGHRFLPRE